MRGPALAVTAAILCSPALAAAPVDWPGYNRTLAGDRFSPLAQISARTLPRLKIACTFDFGEPVNLQTSLVVTGGTLYAATEQDTVAIDPDTCRETWRVRQPVASSPLAVSRGVAVHQGRVFRGGSDGRVRAYDAATGRALWSTEIADPSAGESIPAAPVAWDGLVFIGQAGGDNRGVKGRMYALDAATGRITWEAFLVPRTAGDRSRGPAAPAPPAVLSASWGNDPAYPITGGGTWTSYTIDPQRGLLYIPGGNPAPDFLAEVRPGENLFTGAIVALDARTGAYRTHVQLIRQDWHDWDVAAAPALFTDRAGRRMMAVNPKDGVLYGVDLARGRILYRTPVTTLLNVDTPLVATGTRFCPGTKGGGQWNGPAYDPPSGLLVVGQVDWCTSVRLEPREAALAVPTGQGWSGSVADRFGAMDEGPVWGGWVTAVDAATGEKRWQVRTQTPVLSGVTTTAGGLVFVGEVGGMLHAYDTRTGAELWSHDLKAGLGGGLVTYDTGRGQKVAVATGPISRIWPTPRTSARIVVFGID